MASLHRTGLSTVTIRWHYSETLDQLLDELVVRIGQVAESAISDHGKFRIVLAGGTTPRALYRRLVQLDTDWDHWWIYFGDERMLSRGDPERNETMARDAFLNHVAIPDEQIFPIPTGLDVDSAAIHYRQAIATVVAFDLVLLGVGEDGHTASLFPGHDPGMTTDSPDVLAVRDAPKAPSERISLSASRLSRSLNVWVLATGESKRQALLMFKSGEALPISAIKPTQGIDFFTDIEV